MALELTVATVQMTSVDDVDSNLMQMEALLEDVFAAGSPRLVCFPENCLFLRLIEGQKIEGLTLTHTAFKRLADLAKNYKAYFHLGSVPLYIEGHLYISSVLVSPEGDVLPTYQKMHLFDIQLEGQKPIRESDVYRHGQKPSIIFVDGWCIGESICYDLRYAELYSHYARKEVDLILVPSSFLVRTGEAHWEVLLRGRAIESQAYVVASAQAGTHQSGQALRETYGHSLVVEPWGKIVAELEKRQPGFLLTTLHRDKIEKVRQQIPMKFHRRLPVA